MSDHFQKEGAEYGDFIVTKRLPIPELQSTLIELVHAPTSARVMHIACKDKENLFSILLQTLPSDSTGVAHILEHIVLCGSKKFPVKDPFFSMTRRSMNTFMNAMTGQDFTCYPASTQIEKDFYNLFEVYLDAVFHPELKLLSFLQEGHRLAFQNPKDVKSPLLYQGVVYNEMKGDRSSCETRFWDAIYQYLTPDLPYAHNSGGDPKEIPSLTYEELLAFHENFYHPSRALFFFYGSFPLEGHLEFLQENLLQNTKKLSLIPPLPKQPRFSEKVRVKEKYPIAEEESPEKKTLIAFSWLTVFPQEQLKILTLSLLDHLLLGTDAAFLKKALLKSDLTMQVSSTLDSEMSETPFIIVCKGCDAKDADALEKCLFQELKKWTTRPFPVDEIEAALHQLEFERTEIGADGYPFGLSLFFRSALIKQHGALPEDALCIHSLFKKLRSHLKDPSYLCSFLQKQLLENSHYVRFVLEPDKDLAKQEQEEEEQKLHHLQAHLSSEDKQKIVQQSKELKEYQETKENASLDCLPKLSLNDLNTSARDLPYHKTSFDRFTLYQHKSFTNQILYADLYFDLPDLCKEDLAATSFLTSIFTSVGCAHQSYEKTLLRIDQVTGDLSASLSLHPSYATPGQLSPSFSLYGKALFRNSSGLFALFSDFINSADLTDGDRVKELLKQQLTSLESRLSKAAMHYAIQSSLSSFSVAAYIYHHWTGFGYYEAIRQASKDPETLLQHLQHLQGELIGKGTIDLVLSLEESMAQKLSYDALSLSSVPIRRPWQGNFTLPQGVSHVRFIASPVAFTAYGMGVDYYNPYLLIGAHLLEDCVLHTEIREKGGAYGARADYLPSTGHFYLYSYRDPHLSSTLKTFDRALEMIANGSFSEEALEEAKLGTLQSIDAPISPKSRASTAYSWKRSQRTFDMRNHFRQNILQATKHEVAQAIGSLLSVPKVAVSFLGQDLFEKEQASLPYPLEIYPMSTL